jgi:serine/threonine protein kinase
MIGTELMQPKNSKQVLIEFNVLLFPLQYGVFADIYSLAIILFEFFSGMDPFPGNMGQIFQAKNLDEKPKFPSQFPAALKDLVYAGWSKKPRERPAIDNFRSALRSMLKE